MLELELCKTVSSMGLGGIDKAVETTKALDEYDDEEIKYGDESSHDTFTGRFHQDTARC